MRHHLHQVRRLARNVWKPAVAVSTALILLPLPLVHDNPLGRCGYVLLLSIVLWVTEALPLPITALLPMALFPPLGILSTTQTATNYLNPTIFVFLGSLVLAIAVERSGLHLRMALAILMVTGTGARQIMLGFMATCAFLSMGINNTAATAMMLPIIDAVIGTMKICSENDDAEANNEANGNTTTTAKVTPSSVSTSMTTIDENVSEMQLPEPGKVSQSDLDLDEADEEDDHSASSGLPPHLVRTRNMLLLSVMYAATLGGTATLIGTPANLVLKGLLEKRFDGQTGLTFTSYMLVAFPGMVVNVILAWVYLQLAFLGVPSFKREEKTPQGNHLRDVIRSRYHALGRITLRELEVAALFITLVLLWIFQDDEFVQGWQKRLTQNDVNGKPVSVGDASMVMAVVVLLFVLPAHSVSSSRKWRPLLTWKDVQEHVPWGVLILVGGGFALAEGAEKACVAAWLGTYLTALKPLSHGAIVVLMTAATSLLTEFISNTAAANILLPISAQMATAIGMNPLLVMLPITMACSYGFSIPVGSPPNAIVYAESSLSMKHMMLLGVLMDVIGVLVGVATTYAVGVPYLRLAEFPDWANATAGAMQNNATNACLKLIQ